MKTVTPQQAYDILSKSHGKFFSVKLIKKDGTLRHMNCRTEVKKYLKGGKLPYNPSEYRNIPVFDIEKQAYRTVKCDSLVSFSFNNEEYLVD